MAYHENIGVICFILKRSSIWIAIKPCTCDLKINFTKGEDVDDWLTLCKGPSQSILLGEACLLDDVDAKEALNKISQKITHTPTTYALALKDFEENWSPFFDTPAKDLDLPPVVGFD